MILFASALDLARHESGPQVGIIGVTLVTEHPPRADEHMVFHCDHVLLGVNLPYTVVELVHLLHQRCLNQSGVEDLASVLIDIPSLEVVLVVGNR